MHKKGENFFRIITWWGACRINPEIVYLTSVSRYTNMHYQYIAFFGRSIKVKTCSSKTWIFTKLKRRSYICSAPGENFFKHCFSLKCFHFFLVFPGIFSPQNSELNWDLVSLPSKAGLDSVFGAFRFIKYALPITGHTIIA